MVFKRGILKINEDAYCTACKDGVGGCGCCDKKFDYNEKIYCSVAREHFCKDCIDLFKWIARKRRI